MSRIAYFFMGLCFVLPLFEYGIGNVLLQGAISSPDYLKTLAARPLMPIVGVFLMLANSVTVLAIGVLFFPVLERLDKRAAVAYLATRIIEAILLLVGVVCLWSLIGLSDAYRQARAESYPLLEAFGSVLKQGNFYLFQCAMLLLGLGSLPYCWALYKGRIAPKGLLGALGVGYGLLAVGSVGELCGYPVGVMLSLFGGVMELAWGGWLIMRGLGGLPEKPPIPLDNQESQSA